MRKNSASGIPASLRGSTYDTAESGDPHLLSALVSGREGQEVGVVRVHAETAHDSQCNGEERDAVAACDGTGLYGGIGDPGLDGDRRYDAKCVRRVFTEDSENTLFNS